MELPFVFLPSLVRFELEELILDAGVPIELSGFSTVELDQVLLDDEVARVEVGPLAPGSKEPVVTKIGDIFSLGSHRIVCGDARDPNVLGRLMINDEVARVVLSDVPYNVPISGNASTIDRPEFPMASGEMTDREFLDFNIAWMSNSIRYLVDGGLFGSFIDWRGLHIIRSAAIELGLSLVNLIVWAKTNAGLGSFYRSQHELLPLFKKGSVPHVNNVKLGKDGRWRSNLWRYPGASTMGSDARRGLEDHPTVKPSMMIEDALLDMTNRGDIVLDPFLGSRSTLIAAESTGRVCRGSEIDPTFVDVILRRYENTAGNSSVLEMTGETFSQVAKKRTEERGP